MIMELKEENCSKVLWQVSVVYYLIYVYVANSLLLGPLSAV